MLLTFSYDFVIGGLVRLVASPINAYVKKGFHGYRTNRAPVP
jgi:hypothetical protein